jgi:hypothetical protein
MRVSSPLTILPVILIIPAVAAAVRQRRIVRKFREAGADQPERARTLAELGVLESHATKRFKRSGVLATADGVRYFLSADGLARWERRRNAYVLTATLGALAVVALTWLFLRVG